MTAHCEWCPFPDCDSCAYKGHERVVLLAAYGGIGIRRTARQQRRDWAALDRSIERVVRLQNRRVAVVAKLHRAEAREAS